MKNNNKHTHHDLIVELIGDTSKQVEMVTGSNSVVQVEASNVVADKKGSYIFRIKPREFTKGHWYPCVDKDGDGGVRVFNGEEFCLYSRNINHGEGEDSFPFIGESLGEIKFGGE